MPDTDSIAVAMPTYGVNADTLEQTLQCLSTSFNNAPASISEVIVDHRPTEADATEQVLTEWHENNGVPIRIHKTEHTLPEARQFLIEEVGTEWFLFLDDDVHLRDDTLTHLVRSRAPAVGAVQVRKATHEGRTNSDWEQWRHIRGTTFATLLQTKVVSDFSIPEAMSVLEDEYMRQHVVNNKDKLWIFNHQAIVDHNNQNRHPIGYEEGFIAGKYDLLPYHYVYLNVLYNLLTVNHPLQHSSRALGFTKGKIQTYL